MRRVWGILVFCLLSLSFTLVQGEELIRKDKIKLQTSGSGWYTVIDEFKITSYDVDFEGILMNAVFKEYDDSHQDGIVVTLLDNDRDIEIHWKNHILDCDNNELIYSKIKGALRDKYMIKVTSKINIGKGHFIEIFLTPDQKNDFVVPVYIPSVRVRGRFKVTTHDRYGGKESRWIECDGEAIIPLDRGAALSLSYGQVFFKGSNDYNRIKREK